MESLGATYTQVESLTAAVMRGWWPAVAVLLLVFGLAASRLDDYPILPDGLRSIATAGGREDSADIASLFEKLNAVSQQHVPGYFLVLYFWAQLAGYTPIVLRLMSVFFAVLSLALMYRVGRDFVSREAGLCALVMLASSAFYNLWHLPIRMYSMWVAAALLLIWAYLRVTTRSKTRPRHYALLFMASLLFLYTQTFSLAVCLGIAVYHLLFAAKTKQWMWAAAAGGLAGLLFLPWIGTLLTGAAEIASGEEFGAIAVLSPFETVETIFRLAVNGSILFLVPLGISVKRARERAGVALALWVILLVTVAIYVAVNMAAGAIDLHRSRYFVALFPIVILLIQVGLASLLRWRLAMLVVLLFWIAGGMLFQRRVGAEAFVRSYDTIPIHLIERHLRGALREGDLLTGWSSGLSFDYRTPYDGISGYYFAEHGVEVDIEHSYSMGKMEDEEIAAALEDVIAGKERVWLVYALDDAERFRPIFEGVLERRHQLCLRDGVVAHVAIALYARSGCG